MIEIVNRFLLTGDTFMLKIHLRQPGFTDRASGSFTKTKKKYTGDSGYIFMKTN